MLLSLQIFSHHRYGSYKIYNSASALHCSAVRTFTRYDITSVISGFKYASELSIEESVEH